jgi:protein required for attachment to host cells
MARGITWIVVADGGSARILEQQRASEGLSIVADGAMERFVQRSGEINADRPGRSFDSHGTGRHAMEPHTPAGRVAERTFLRRLARRLEVAAVQKRFEHLVLVAPPRAMGELRELMNAHVQHRISAEIVKDLTHVPEHELLEHLADEMSA